MAGTRLTFLLDGRDALSRVLDRAGDNADRLGRRLLAASINGDAAMRRLGNTTTTRMAGLQRDTDLGEKALKELKGTLISLAPAAIPAAASLAPIAAGAGAAAVAVAAFGAALGPQISAMSGAVEAEKAYSDAVAKSGKTSEAAIAAQLEYQRTVSALPPETRRAAAGLSVLKDEYKAWSDGLAKDTMAPVVKGMGILTALLPKTTGLVKGASAQLDRLMTVVAGGMASPGLDQLNRKFTAFATGTLQKVNDQLIHLMRTTDAGKIGGGVSQFMDYARAQGPVVADTLRNVGTALINVLRAGSDVGVGMLDLINALSGIVAAIPPGAIAAVLQLALAIKAVKLAAVGMAAARTAMAAFGTQLVAMQVAAAAAPGRLAAVTAAIGAMSRGAKLALAGTGIGLLLIALTELSANSKKAPPDVDKLTTSLKIFADTGKVSGEAARAFGRDLSGLGTALQKVTDPKGLDKFQQSIISFFGTDSTPVKDAKENIDAFDKSLAGLVSSGNAKLAAAALQDTINKLESQGKDTGKLRAQLDDYKNALADQAFEQKLAAQGMGLFGQQALATRDKLDAQKMSADGLRASIIALNNVNRSAYDSQIAFEGAVDGLTASFKEHGNTLDLDTKAGRANGQAMSQAAAAQDEMIASGLAAGESLKSMTGKSDKLRGTMMRLALEAFDGNKKKAREYVNELLGVPGDIKTAVELERNDAITGLQAVQAAIKATPGAKSVKVDALNGAAIKALEAVGLKTRVLPDGRIEVTAKNGQALAGIGAVQRARDRLNDKTIRITTITTAVRRTFAENNTIGRPGSGEGGESKYASGGLVGFPGGGMVSGPGTGTSDSILARVSNGEFVIRAKSVARYGTRFLAAVNEGRLGMAAAVGNAGGSMAGAGAEAGRGLAVGLRAAAAGVDGAARVMASAVVTGIRAELQIASPSKRTKALAADVGKGLIVGLTGSKAKISSASKDLAKDIWSAFTGSKDNRLVAMVNRETKKLLAAAAKRDALISKIATAKKYASTLTTAARQESSLGQLGIEEGKVSAGTIAGGLSAKLAQIRTFTSYIGTLAKRGLSKTLIRQILDMGPEQGYAYASALAGASSSTLKSINATQSSIDKATTTLGRNGADLMYDSGKQAGKGFLTGLTSQQKAIEDQMLRIAKGMQKAIKKALGIRSPSRVMAQLGRYSTEGLAVGLTDRMPVLDRALGAVTDRVASAQPVIGRPAIAGGGRGGAPTYIQIDVNGAMDPVAVGRELQKVLVKFGRVQGGAVTLKTG